MHPNDDLLNTYADESIDAADRAPVEAHLASCAACRQTVDDLREVLRATTTLELREPSVRAWSRIERAIALERESHGGTPSPQSSQNPESSVARRVLRVPRVLRPA